MATIRRLVLKNIERLKTLERQLDPKLNSLVGDNGQRADQGSGAVVREPRGRGKRLRPTTPDDAANRPVDWVNRQLRADRPNQLWVSDFTYVSTWPTIKDLYKAKLIQRRAPWKTKESVELATLEWVAWFNHKRLLSSIGYIPPARRRLFCTLDRPTLRNTMNIG